MSRTPVVFVSHGAPSLPLEQHGAPDFLRRLGSRLDRPRAIAVVSAHWESSHAEVSDAAHPETIYDFYGFPRELYRLRYPCPGAPDAAARTYALLRRALPVVGRENRGLDHGAWIPLLLMYPQADIPVFQISLQTHAGPAGAYALGRALAPLRDEGVLLLCSGSAVHNLRTLSFEAEDVPAWARAFDDWVAERLTADDADALVGYRRRAPSAEAAHPSEEHLLPLLVAHGAGACAGVPLYRGFSHGTLSMSAYGFGV